MLVHTRPLPSLRPIESSTSYFPKISGHHPCGSCRVCHLTSVTHSVEFQDGASWNRREFSNCNTPNVVYRIKCPCNLLYVGMTSRKVKLRIIEHCSTIRCRKATTKLTTHFVEMNHTPNDLKWVVI